MMLVVDITKGMQTQTAECLIIGEITCEMMLVVLNKIDLIPIEKRQATIEKVRHLAIYNYVNILINNVFKTIFILLN